MKQYFLHNGYCGWSYGAPSDPQLIKAEDAAEIMKGANLTSDQVSFTLPPAQYAEENDELYALTGKNRFICFAEIDKCADVKQEKINVPLEIQWVKP